MGALDYAITSLDLLGATLKVLPFVGETLKGAVELATKICETVQVRPSLLCPTAPLMTSTANEG
jgi:hypothetical protein